MSFRVLVCETVTGEIVQDVQPAGLPDFSRAISDKGSWEVDVLVDEKANRGIDFTQYTSARFSFAILFDSYVLQAGPVWSYSIDDTKRQVTFSGAGIGSIFSRRIVRNPWGGIPSNITHTANDLNYTLSLRGILDSLVGEGMGDTGYDLPINIEIPAEAGTNTRTYYGYDLKNLWDALVDLSQVIDGPEFDFAPSLNEAENKIYWDLLMGTPLLGDQDSPAVWDYGAAISSITVDGDASTGPVYRAWEKGSGQDRDVVIGFAQNDAAIADGTPALEYVGTEHNDATVKDTLNSYASGDLTEYARPQETWSCSARIDGLNDRGGRKVSPTFGEFALGDKPMIGVHGHFWIPDGDYRRRITGFSKDTSQTVSLDLQPEPAVL